MVKDKNRKKTFNSLELFICIAKFWIERLLKCLVWSPAPLPPPSIPAPGHTDHSQKKVTEFKIQWPVNADGVENDEELQNEENIQGKVGYQRGGHSQEGLTETAVETFLTHILIHTLLYAYGHRHRLGSLGSSLWGGEEHTVGFSGSAYRIATYARDRIETGLSIGGSWAEMLHKDLRWPRGEL